MFVNIPANGDFELTLFLSFGKKGNLELSILSMKYCCGLTIVLFEIWLIVAFCTIPVYSERIKNNEWIIIMVYYTSLFQLVFIFLFVGIIVVNLISVSVFFLNPSISSNCIP